MSRRKNHESTEVNADAFLDTVANLVGILVILVIVVASQTKMAAREAAKQELLSESTTQINDQLENANNVEKDLFRQAQVLQQQSIVVALRKQERDQLLLEILQQKEDLTQQRNGLNDDQKLELADSVEQEQLSRKLEKLLIQQGDIEASDKAPAAITLQHLPTPMAKTVFGDEVHILLQNNQLSIIPWDQLIDGLKRQAQMSASRPIRSERLVDTLGPIDGFIMKYALSTKRGLISNGGSTSVAQSVELEYFVLEPTVDTIRENLNAALDFTGRLRAELSLHSPRDTTITVWVYPDSFGTFRGLKEQLFSEGFLTAARPLPEGIRVGASPNGSSSTAE